MSRKTMGLVSLLFFLFSGCALTQANLKVDYDPAKTPKSALSSVGASKVSITEFTDKRAEKDKIGYKRNAFGSKMAPITTVKPVPQIVRDAVSGEFVKNGLVVDAPTPDGSLTGDITSFWFDYQVGFTTVEFMGTVGVDMTLKDARTGEVRHAAKYQGHFNEKSLGGLEGTWERVMNGALEDMIRDMSADRKLVEALKGIGSDSRLGRQ
jgi:uncharacterized lipoprotein YajG